jgi:hypothetical protein
VYQARSGEAPPRYFLTHGRNFSKFDQRPGYRIIGHLKSRDDATACCRYHNEKLLGHKRPRVGHQLSKLGKDIDLTRLGQPKEKQPRLILPKDFKRTDK